ncbi:MAG: ZIP family metal transporter [Clostridia bacterium]|nr:ZIP family metal transporter [Clostridia bacterium]
MLSLFAGLPHLVQALIATLFTWSVTAAGAALVYLFQKPKKIVMDCMLGFSAGVMIAASYWSLLAPAIDMANTMKLNPWMTVLIGFLGGGALLLVGDQLYEYVNQRKTYRLSDKRCAMLMLSITLHNIPEGMAVGVAFGSLAYALEGATLTAACLLALGIGLQNFPEGTAVSVPMLREGRSKHFAFFMGQLSGFVEPVAGVIGALLVLRVRALLPYMLSFAAGAMIYVAVQELIPESQKNPNRTAITFFTMAGFSMMMVLDVALG